MPSRRLTMGLAAAALVLALSFVHTGPLTAANDKAADFQLGSIDGNSTVKLSSFTDKATVLVFWASWCPHCQRELPVVQRLYDELKSKGLNAVGVSADENVEDARRFVKSAGVTFPNAFAGSEKGQKVLSEYGIKGVPALYVIEKGGTVVAHFLGETDEQTLRSTLAKAGVK